MTMVEPKRNGVVAGTTRRLLSVRHLTDRTFVASIEGGGVPVQAGQHMTLGVSRSGVNREYSVYTVRADDTLEFLITVREGSFVSESLQHSAPGTEMDVAGPFGAFMIERPHDTARRYTFIASSVGIAPFHAFVKAYPALDYQLLHGVRKTADRYDYTDYAPNRYRACVSREAGGDFRGRVTEYLERNPMSPDRLCYMCGSNAMVSDVYDLLRRQGVYSDNLFTEVFF